LPNDTRPGAAEDIKMSHLSRVESLEETSFSNSIERSVGAADATLQHLASAKETFGDLEAAYRTFKHELEIVKTEHAAQVSKFYILLLPEVAQLSRLICGIFINVFCRKATGFHRQAKLFELKFFI